MATFRENHKEKGNFTQVSNALILDTRISSKAKLYLILMLSRPDTWKFSVDGLLRSIKEGKDALKSGLDELTEFGYLKKEKRHIKGRWDWDYTIIENPTDDPNIKQENNQEEKPKNEKPETPKSPAKNKRQKNSIRKIGALKFRASKTKSYSNTGSSNTDFSNTDLQRESEKTAHAEKQEFGKYKNVLLTPEEYGRLVETYGKDQTDRSIEGMSDYMQIHNKSYPNVFARLDLWIRQDIEKAKQSPVPCQSEKSNQKSDSDFDVHMYDIFINNFDLMDLESEEARKKDEEEKKRRAEEEKSYAEREKAERDAHFAELIAHMQKHQAKNENIVDSVTPDYSAFMNDYVTI